MGNFPRKGLILSARKDRRKAGLRKVYGDLGPTLVYHAKNLKN
jgi:hypothetical protein